MSTALEGGCGCGGVRYRIDREPIFVNNCHCRQCQRQTGSTSVVNMFLEREALTVRSGTTMATSFVAGSGGEHKIFRCTICGTALWSEYPRLGDLAVGVRVGTLDDPTSVTPDAAIFLSEKMPWVSPPASLPGFERSYLPADLLSPERLARLAALLQRRVAEKS